MTDHPSPSEALRDDDFRDEHERAMRDHILAEPGTSDRHHTCTDLCSDDIVTRLADRLAARSSEPPASPAPTAEGADLQTARSLLEEGQYVGSWTIEDIERWTRSVEKFLDGSVASPAPASPDEPSTAPIDHPVEHLAQAHMDLANRVDEGFSVTLIEDARRAASASVPPPLDVETDAEIRYLLWVLHGHNGRYGDDGEMQCGWCRLDYRRDPLSKITAHLTSLSSSLDRYAAETPEQPASREAGQPEGQP